MTETFKALCEQHIRRLPMSNLLNQAQLSDIVQFLCGATDGDLARLDLVMTEAVQMEWARAPQIFDLRRIVDGMRLREVAPGKGCPRCDYRGYLSFECEGLAYSKPCDCVARGVATTRLIHGASEVPDPGFPVEMVSTLSKKNALRLGAPPKYDDDPSLTDAQNLERRFAQDRARDAAKRDPLANVKPASDEEIERIKALQEKNRLEMVQESIQ